MEYLSKSEEFLRIFEENEEKFMEYSDLNVQSKLSFIIYILNIVPLSENIPSLLDQLESFFQSATKQSVRNYFKLWLPIINGNTIASYYRAYHHFLQGHSTKVYSKLCLLKNSLPLSLLFNAFGCYYLKLNKIGLAVYFLESSVREMINPNPIIYYNLALAYFIDSLSSYLGIGKFENAIKFFGKCLVSDPIYWIRLCDSYLQTKETPESLRYHSIRHGKVVLYSEVQNTPNQLNTKHYK